MPLRTPRSPVMKGTRIARIDAQPVASSSAASRGAARRRMQSPPTRSLGRTRTRVQVAEGKSRPRESYSLRCGGSAASSSTT